MFSFPFSLLTRDDSKVSSLPADLGILRAAEWKKRMAEGTRQIRSTKVTARHVKSLPSIFLGWVEL